LNAKYRGHKPRLVETVTKRLECEMCGVSWLRGKPPLGPCRGPDRDVTPVVGPPCSLRRWPIVEGS
jgi:hypothetical protein